MSEIILNSIEDCAEQMYSARFQVHHVLTHNPPLNERGQTAKRSISNDDVAKSVDGWLVSNSIYYLSSTANGSQNVVLHCLSKHALINVTFGIYTERSETQDPPKTYSFTFEYSGNGNLNFATVHCMKIRQRIRGR